MRLPRALSICARNDIVYFGGIKKPLLRRFYFSWLFFVKLSRLLLSLLCFFLKSALFRLGLLAQHVRLRGLGSRLLLELLNASRAVDKLLFSGKKWVARRTKLDCDFRHRRTCDNYVAACACYLGCRMIGRVYSGFHNDRTISGVARYCKTY